MTGFIAWPRDMESTFPWYTTPNTLVLFVHLVTKANIRPSYFAGKKVDRGCVVTSIGRLAEETGLTEKQVRTALDHLTQTGDIIRESSNRFTFLRVQQYDRFNTTAPAANEGQTEGKQAADQWQAEGKQTAIKGQHHDKEDKEDKEDKKEDSSVSDAVKAIVEAWNARCGSALKISRITPQSTRYKSLAARVDDYGMGEVLRAVGNVAESAFLKNATWFSFDWFVKPNNFVKVLDGNYSDRRTGKTDAGPKADEPAMTDADRQRVRDDYSARMLRGDY